MNGPGPLRKNAAVLKSLSSITDSCKRMSQISLCEPKRKRHQGIIDSRERAMQRLHGGWARVESICCPLTLAQSAVRGDTWAPAARVARGPLQGSIAAALVRWRSTSARLLHLPRQSRYSPSESSCQVNRRV